MCQGGGGWMSTVDVGHDAVGEDTPVLREGSNGGEG